MSDSENSNSEITFRYKTQSVRRKEDEKDYCNTIKRNIDLVHEFNSDEKRKNKSKLKTKHLKLSKETSLEIINSQMPYNFYQNTELYSKTESKKNKKNGPKSLLENESLENYSCNNFINNTVNSFESGKSDILSFTDTVHETPDTYGPILPPNWKNSQNKIIGPSLPPGFVENQNQTDLLMNLNPEPKNIDNLKKDESDIEIIGPFPVDNKSDLINSIETRLEERALEIKLKSLIPTSKDTVREDWMLKLPDVKAISTLGPRQFRSKEGPDMTNRSVWTDTPNSIKKETTINKYNEQQVKDIQKRNIEQEQMINDYKKHKKDKKSLLQMHQEKLSKKKKKEDEPVRRPFNRDIDLKINTFSEEQKKSIFNKAKFLDSRFSSGASKYL